MFHLLQTLRSRLLLLVLLAMLPALGLILHNAETQRRMEVEEAHELAMELARQVAGNYRQQITSGRQILAAISQLDAVQQQDTPACSHLVGDLIQSNKLYVNLFAVNPAGSLFCNAVPQMSNINLRQSEWLRRALDSKTFTAGTDQVGGANQEPLLVLAYPNFEGERQVNVVALLLNLDSLPGEPAAPALAAPWTLTLLDDTLNVLAQRPAGRGWVGETAPLAQALRAALGANSQATFESGQPDGVPRLFGAVRLTANGSSDDGLYVLVSMPLSAAYASADAGLRTSLILLALAAVLALGATWWAGDLFVLRQVRALTQAVQRLRGGDLAARADIAGSTLEVRGVAEAFNAMATSLEQHDAEQRQTEAALRIAVRNLDRARGDLEQRVAERTAELAQANAALEAEVLQHQGTEEDLRLRNAELAALYAVAAAASILDPETLLQRVLDLVLPVLGSPMGWVTLPGLAPEAPQRIAAARGLPESFQAFEAGHTLAACPQCARLLADNSGPTRDEPVADCPLLTPDLIEATFPSTHASVPLRSGDRLLGILNVGWLDAPDYEEEHRALLSVIGRQVGVALENAQLYQEVRKQFQQLQQSQTQLIQAEKLAVMGRLAASFAHEINNPLQAIRSHLELSLDYPLPPDERDQYLKIARQEIERLSEVTSRVLGFYRPAKTTHNAVGVVDLVQRTMALVTRQIQVSHIEVALNLTGQARVLAASDQTVQVFLNLLINAIEAIGENGRITITERLEGDQVAVIFVNDGPPIPPEHLDRLFEPFFTTKAGGTGLGLSISRSLIEQYGGSLTAANLAAGGVAFTVRLPVVQNEGAPHSIVEATIDDPQ